MNGGGAVVVSVLIRKKSMSATIALTATHPRHLRDDVISCKKRGDPRGQRRSSLPPLSLSLSLSLALSDFFSIESNDKKHVVFSA